MGNISELSYALNTFFIVICAALVFWMAAGFSMLEAGLVRTKNTAEILVKNIGLFAISCLAFFVLGYNIMYPGDKAMNTFFSNFGFTSVVREDGDFAESANFLFQVVFVATAMSIVSGAVAERMKLWAFFLFCAIFTAFIYPLQGYWVWGNGFLNQLGFIDFAGSGVVHLSGASAALAGVWLLGARRGKYSKSGKIRAIPGANLPLATLGTFVLWLGWLGFNGGSVLSIASTESANQVAKVFLNTIMAGVGGGLSAIILSRVFLKYADLTMILNGVIGGLVAITADPSSPAVETSIFIGGIAGLLVIFFVILIDRLKIDDPVGALSAHGVCGIWGLLAVVFSNEEASLYSQSVGLVSIFIFVFSSSLVVWFVIKKLLGIRISYQEEHEGMDIHECGIQAYPEFSNK